MSEQMTFVFESSFILEETFKDYVMVVGTLLSEGLSKHGYWYSVEETDFNNVVKTALGKPIYYGTLWTGEHNAPKIKGKHLQLHSERFNPTAKSVGKVVKTWFDKVSRKVKAKLKIWEPSLINTVKRGFKISIRGLFDRFIKTIRKGKRVVIPVKLRISDIQLLPPTKQVGVKDAQVEHVLEETMAFSCFDHNFCVIDAVIAQLVADGEI